MNLFREVQLPSGAVLKVQPAPFADSKALSQAFAEKAEGIDLGSQDEIGVLIKNVLLGVYASKKIETCLWVCMQRCLYKDLKIDKDTFEPAAAREDYITVCKEVMEENISPFMKSLFAAWKTTVETIESVRASRQQTTPS